MSKKNVLNFLSKASADEKLREKLRLVASQNELVGVGAAAGYDFSQDDVDAVVTELKQKPGFFSVLASGVFELFGPVHDDYPATGVQPFTGDPAAHP